MRNDGYLITWKDKNNGSVSHTALVYGHGAMLVAQLLKENNYDYSVKKSSGNEKELPAQ